MRGLHNEDRTIALWENEPDRAHRLSGAPPHRHYVKSGRFTGLKVGPSPRPPGLPYKPRPGPKLPTKPRHKPGGFYKPTQRPAFRPFIDPKRVPFGRPPSPNPQPPFRPLLNPKGLGLLGRFAKPLPLTVLFLLLDVLPFSRGSDPGYDMPAGWSLWCDSGLGPLQLGATATANPNIPCPTGGQVPQFGYGADLSLAANIKWIAFGRSQLGGIRFRTDQQWVKPDGNSPPIKYYPNGRPGGYGWPDAPTFWPQLDPHRLPILKPAFPPRPIPFPLLPHRPPNPETGPMPYPGSRVRRFRHGGNLVPSFNIPIKPDPDTGRPRPDRPRPGVHVRRPPNKREKEKKYIIGVNGATKLARLIGLLTEFSDLLDVAWKSLPSSITRKYIGANRITKLAVILQNLENIQPGTFLAGYLSDTLEDTAFGKLGKISAKAARALFADLKGSVGLQTGPADTPPGPVIPGGDPWVAALDDWLDENVYQHTIGNTSWKGMF